jgi:hypothetical protein
MEVLKIVLVTVSISLGVAAVGTLLVSSGLDTLERMRQRWVARAEDAVKIAHAG